MTLLLHRPTATLKTVSSGLFKQSISRIMPGVLYSTAPKGDLFKYQDKLPSLPVPPLEHTLELYKRSIIPYYPGGSDDPDFEKYSNVIDEFGKSRGPVLQERLLSYANGQRNWLSQIWDDYAYLGYREPVSPFVSYFFSHKDLNTVIGKDQLLKAASLSFQVLKFKEAVESETLEPELIKNNPYCMESFRWMFNNCRVPDLPSDTTVRFNPEENRFMTVISNGYIYKLYHNHAQSQELLNPAELYAGLDAIYEDSHDKPTNKNPIGILTSSNRDVWAKNYEQLCKNPVNRISLEQIQRSSFTLCLDDDFPSTIAEKSRNCWHGNGFNRWFDKPVEIFVAKNASSGFLGEHSKMDGTPTLRMNDWIVKQVAKMTAEDFASETPSEEDISFEELRFEIDPVIHDAIDKEFKVFNETVNSLDINVWQYFGVGKDQIKLFKASPDAFIQMLLQLAYYKYTGVVRPTYESASTRKYFGGRTETCRSVSPESLQFVRDWEDTSKTPKEKIASFRNAVNAHVSFIKEASDGLGVDRHLLGLTQMIEEGEEFPEIFADPMYPYSQHWYLSTSQLSSSEFNGYGWSPVVPEGFGLAYMINKDWCHVNITVFKNNPLGLRADVMAFYLTQAMNELKDVLSKEEIKSKL
ncbi:DEKNAAC101987 [Brettanomyces naardenensis]|uniref:Carnitine O-acetyltransferase, mitochondrial n=1 Tax=Brettanomyces naardenensis TaxID=13370 RepID=A0A448YJM0_BRENA|nr:DEKNAAC101987 [Brettanomyces naardenensis]